MSNKCFPAPEWTEVCEDTGAHGWRTLCACSVGEAVVVFGTQHPSDAIEVFMYVGARWVQPERTRALRASGVPPHDARYVRATGIGAAAAALVWTTGAGTMHTARFDVGAMEWSGCRLAGAAVRQPRIGYGLAAVSGLLFLFGGVEETQCAKKPFLQVRGGSGAENVVACTERGGVGPSRRAYAAVCAGPMETILVHGGVEEGGGVLCDLWSYDTQNMLWMEVLCTVPLCKHALAASPNWLVLFGGVRQSGEACDDLHLFEVRSGRWERVTSTVGDAQPAGRAYPVLCARHSGDDGCATFWMFGGGVRDRVGGRRRQVSDLHCLRVWDVDAEVGEYAAHLQEREALRTRIDSRLTRVARKRAAAEQRQRELLRDDCGLEASLWAVRNVEQALAGQAQLVDAQRRTLDTVALASRDELRRANLHAERLRHLKVENHRVARAVQARGVSPLRQRAEAGPPRPVPGLPLAGVSVPAQVRGALSAHDACDIEEARARAAAQLLEAYALP